MFTSCKQEKIGLIDNAEVINAYPEKTDIKTK